MGINYNWVNMGKDWKEILYLDGKEGERKRYAKLHDQWEEK